jgi:hypothetical protein
MLIGEREALEVWFGKYIKALHVVDLTKPESLTDADKNS